MTVIDAYLEKIEKSKRKELERIRSMAMDIVPDAQETIKYAMPTLTVNGKPFLGFDAHKSHIGIYPYSGDVVEKLKDLLSQYETSKGAIRMPLGKPILRETLKQIIDCRLEQLKASK